MVHKYTEAHRLLKAIEYQVLYHKYDKSHQSFEYEFAHNSALFYERNYSHSLKESR